MKQLGQSAITTGSGTLVYTVPTGYKADIRDVCIANTSSSAITFSLSLVPSGGSAGTANRMFPDISIPANTLIHWCGNQILDTGDFIQCIGSASGVTVTVSGDEIRNGGGL